MTIIQQGFNACLPKHDETDRDTIHYRIIAFMCCLVFLIGLYSLIKWSVAGYSSLAMWAWVIVIGEPLLLIVNKMDRLPRMLVANMQVLLAAIYCASLVYYLGGLRSAHIYWPVVLIALAFTVCDRNWGLFWGGIMVIEVITFIVLDRAGYQLPAFELDAKQEMVNTYSGYILPMLAQTFSLAYMFKLRNIALADAADAAKDSLYQAEKGKALTDQLQTILAQASSSAETLLDASTRLSTTTQDMNNNSQSISKGGDEQLESTHKMNGTLRQMADSARQTAGAMDVIRQKSEQVQKNTISSCESMREAIGCMEKIKEGNNDILEFMGGHYSDCRANKPFSA